MIDKVIRGVSIMRLSVISFTLALVLSIHGAAAMEIIHIQSLRSGVIKIDGYPVSLNGLAEALLKIKSKNGAAWYYREGPDQQPTESQIKAFKEIMSAGVSLSMSSKSDFSDFIDGNGKSHPR